MGSILCLSSAYTCSLQLRGACSQRMQVGLVLNAVGPSCGPKNNVRSRRIVIVSLCLYSWVQIVPINVRRSFLEKNSISHPKYICYIIITKHNRSKINFYSPTTMETLQKIHGRFTGASESQDEELKMPLGSSKSWDSSDETETLPYHPQSLFQLRQLSHSRLLKGTTSILLAAVILLSIFNVVLLNQVRLLTTWPDLKNVTQQRQTTNCGSSVTEAKSKNYNWDELTKAWLPPECPMWGIDEYKREGMIYSPYFNLTGWDYYQDRNGTIQVNLLALAKDENRDPSTTLWTSSRQHLTHCAWSLKRILWT